MPNICKRLAALALLFTLATLAVSAQEIAGASSVNEERDAAGASAPQATGSQPPYLDKGANEFGVWGGASFDSPTLIGKSEDSRFGIVGLRYARVVAAGNGMALKYTIDAVPVAVLSYERGRFVPDSTPGVFRFETSRKSVYGAGIAPIGLQLNFRRSKRVQPFAGGSLGFIYFTEPVPDERSVIEPGRAGKQFNFTADFGGGVQFFTSERRALTFGYRYHHLSNGNRGEINPGFDSNLFYAGFSFFK